MRRFTSVSAASPIDAAVRLDAEGRRAVVVGGGSDLLGMIKDDLVAPRVMINLRSIGGLDEVRVGDGRGVVRIGGLVTLSALAAHSLIAATYRAIAEAAGSAATPQIRNVATLAGNLCQRPWCWYYRQRLPCFKHGGNRCFSRAGQNQFNAIFGGGPSYIVHPSDTAPALVALGASFRIVGPSGGRTVPASEFFTLPSVDVSRENVLEANELLTEVELPPAPAGLRSTYAKVLDREAWTHAVVSVAVSLVMGNDVVQRAAVVLGGVAPIPWPLPAVAELLVGERVTETLAVEAGRLAVTSAEPLAKNGYKVTLTENLVRHTLLSLTD